MLLTDIDNLMYKIEVENVYDDFYKDKDLFDFSICPKDSKYYNNSNNLVVGKLKDETCGAPMKNFVGLKSKIYIFITKDNHEYVKVRQS